MVYTLQLLIKRTYTLTVRCHIKNSHSIMFIHVATVFMFQQLKNVIARCHNEMVPLGNKADRLT